MKKIIIFEVGDSAELAKYYLENDEKYKYTYKVEGFTIDSAYKNFDKFLGLPLVNFEEVEKIFTPEEYYLFNTLREEKYLEGKLKGYNYINYISSKATIFGKINGENNFIEEGVMIQPFVKVANNNVIRYGTTIGHHSEVPNNCFIAPKVNIAGRTLIKNNCFLGINSIIFDHLVLEERILVGGGRALIRKNTEKEQVIIGKDSIKLDKKSIDIKI